MPVFEDWLKDPLSIINNIFTSDPTNFDQKIQEYFQDKLKSEKNYLSIPCLNEVAIHDLKPNCLVRYRCMIQDSFDPVYYSGVHKLKNKRTDNVIQVTFKYKETLEIPEDYEEFNEEISDDKLKVTDSLENAMDIHFTMKNQANLQQRMTFYCVPIPGESEWVKQVYKSNNPPSSTGSVGLSSNTSHRPTKRAIECENIADPNPETCLVELTNNQSSDELKNIENIQLTDALCKNCSILKISNGKETKSAKKSKTDTEADESKINYRNANNLNFPLSSHETGIACLVKAYDNFESYRINDIVEFIGILSQEPALAYQHDEHGDSNYHCFQMNEKLLSKISLEENPMETETESNCRCGDKENQSIVLSSFPPSLVPRLHCIKSHHLMHNNPYLNKENLADWTNNDKEVSLTDEERVRNYWRKQHTQFLTTLLNDSNEMNMATYKLSPNLDSLLFENAKSHLHKLRQSLIDCFQEMLLGDALAAEYLLMHLLSSVFMRKDVTVLGKFSLNLTNIPQTLPKVPNQQDENRRDNFNEDFAASFYQALSQFVSMAHLFELTVDNLNKSNLIPNKDYSKNKLITGMLQLPDNFHLIVDETALNTGELNAKGLMNFNSIKDIVTYQKLNYDFNYHHQEFPTNIRVLILSQTKSILPSDCQLKINSSVQNFESDIYDSSISNLIRNKDTNLLNKFRNYLTVVSKLDYKIPEPIQKIVEDDIINVRKHFNASVHNKTNGTLKPKVLSVDDIHLILIVARLQSLSYGMNELGINEWNKAKALEFERLHTRL